MILLKDLKVCLLKKGYLETDEKTKERLFYKNFGYEEDYGDIVLVAPGKHYGILIDVPTYTPWSEMFVRVIFKSLSPLDDRTIYMVEDPYDINQMLGMIDELTKIRSKFPMTFSVHISAQRIKHRILDSIEELEKDTNEKLLNDGDRRFEWEFVQSFTLDLIDETLTKYFLIPLPSTTKFVIGQVRTNARQQNLSGRWTLGDSNWSIGDTSGQWKEEEDLESMEMNIEAFILGEIYNGEG